MSGLEFDNKISLGHIISLGFMFIAGITAYADLRATQTQFHKDMTAFSIAADQRENRMRAVEIAQAGQSSDLRAILTSITRIENSLGKLGVTP